MPKKLVIGLVGGMGSGKSRVAEEFARRGACVVNGDRLGHEALDEPAIREELVRRWGREILDENGHIARSRVGPIVFADKEERQALEAVVHPYIAGCIRAEIEKAQTDPRVKFVVLDAAIMIETGWDKVCDRLIYVHAPRAERLRRLADQRGWSEKEVDAREHAQLSLTQKASRADSAIDNSDSPGSLARQIEDLLRRWEIDS
jgi:dephospho-CoA kinase